MNLVGVGLPHTNTKQRCRVAQLEKDLLDDHTVMTIAFSACALVSTGND